MKKNKYIPTTRHATHIKMNQLPSEIILIVGEHLQDQDVYSLYSTCTRMRDILQRVVWSTLTIIDTPPKVNTITNTNRITSFVNLSPFIQQNQNCIKYIKKLDIQMHKHHDKVPNIMLNCFTNLSNINITATITQDETIDTLSNIIHAYPFTTQHVNLNVTYDWCVPDSPLITETTASLVIITNKFNDLRCLAKNLIDEDSTLKLSSIPQLVLSDKRRNHIAKVEQSSLINKRMVCVY